MSKDTKQSKRSITGMISVLCTIVFFLIGAFLLWLTNEKDNTSRARVAEFQKQEVELEKQLNALDNQTSQTKEEVTVTLKSCANLGEEVMNCQNFYGTTAADASSDESRKAIQENAEKLKTYFTTDDASKVGVPWCVLPNAKWVFNTTYSFTDTKVPVLWTYISTSTGDDNSGGDLYAYATANYDAETKLFSDFDLHTTRLGNSKSLND